MNPKKTKKLAIYAVSIVLSIALIWLIVELASQTPNAADPTVGFSKNTEFPFDDNLELEVEGDPDVEGEKDPAPDDTQNTEPDGKKEPDSTTGETEEPGADPGKPEDADSVISGDEADAYIDADKFFG